MEPVPGNKSSCGLTFESGHKTTASRSQVSRRGAWRSGPRAGTAPDAFESIGRRGRVGHAAHVIRRSGLQVNRHRPGISLVSPVRRDLSALLVYVQVAGAAPSSSKDTGDFTAPSLKIHLTGSMHKHRFSPKRTTKLLSVSSNAITQLFLSIPFCFCPVCVPTSRLILKLLSCHPLHLLAPYALTTPPSVL